MKTVSISLANFEFLKDLKTHNYREWFQENKARYEAAHANMIEFTEEMIARMSEYDNIVQRTGKKSLFRIYRDVRFSKDKSPYKTSWGGSMKRDTKWLRGGYYFHIEPGNTHVAGGFWAPNSDDLRRIREEIAADDKPLRRIVASSKFQDMFGRLEGERVKTAPKGFSREHPAIDLIRMKQFVVRRVFTDKETLSEGLMDEMVETFRAMRPYFDYMSEVLTTNANGEPIWEKA